MKTGLFVQLASMMMVPGVASAASVDRGSAIPIFRIFDNRLEIFANGRPDYAKYPEASDFMSCGMRASFAETIRIDVGGEVSESYRKSLTELPAMTYRVAADGRDQPPNAANYPVETDRPPYS